MDRDDADAGNSLKLSKWKINGSANSFVISYHGKVKTDMYSGKLRINIIIEQMQDDNVFIIDVPINIATEKGVETFVFNMDKKEQDFQISLNSKPLKLVVDSQYDVFRILNPAEVPPTLSKIWGSKNNLIVLPGKASKEQKEIYKNFAKQWQESDNDNFIIKYDTDLKELPKDKTAWIIGFENKFTIEINQQLSENNSKFTADSVIFKNKKLVKLGSILCFRFVC